MEPAKTLIDLYRTVNPDESLYPKDARYVDLSPARGADDLASLITRRIITAVSPNYHQRLVTGHRGSGKSTELHRLESMLNQAGFLVVYLDVEITLDLADLEYLDVLVAIAYSLQDATLRNKIKIDERLLKNVEEWFGEIISVREERVDSEMGIQTEAKVGVEVPLLARLLASATSQIRSGSTSRQEIRLNLEQRLEDLINRLKLLVDNITENARRKGFKGLVVIVDSMEKIPLKIINEQGITNHSLLFIEHAEQLKSLPCHLIATVPVSLLSDRNLGIAFTDIDLIPMVKISTPDQQNFQEGLDLLIKVVARRIDTQNLFESNDDVLVLIQASGGVIRDLMRLLLFSADYTPLDGKVNNRACELAVNKIVREYDRLIHQEDLETLQAVLRNPYIPSSNTLARLMYNRLVLPYINSENWVTLHPAVKKSVTFRTSSGILET